MIQFIFDKDTGKFYFKCHTYESNQFDGADARQQLKYFKMLLLDGVPKE
jgi:hypothetical protein